MRSKPKCVLILVVLITQSCECQATDVDANVYAQTCATKESIPLSPLPIPVTIRELLKNNYMAFDPAGADLVVALNAVDAVGEFPHARTTFFEHLVGTYGMLGAWKQPLDVMRCGLVHTAYSGDLFPFFLYNASSASERAQLRDIIGLEAEHLTWLFGTVHRGALIGLEAVIRGEPYSSPHEHVLPGGNETCCAAPLATRPGLICTLAHKILVSSPPF